MEKVVIKIRLVFFLVFFANAMVLGQEAIPPLERKISVEFGGEYAKDVLKTIEDKAKLTFAYKTGTVDDSLFVNMAYIDKTVREILDDIFKGSISYKTKGNYIFLRENTKAAGSEVFIEGYIVDINTQQKILYATIYDQSTLSSAVSDEFGHYMLKLEENKETVIRVKKVNYTDEEVVYKPNGSSVINIYLHPIAVQNEDSLFLKSDQDTLVNPLKRIQSLKWLKLSPERRANILNFKEIIDSKTQISLLPNIGTNGTLSSSTVVDYSFNILGGFVGGVRVLELAGIFNLDLDTVKYAQAAGVFNVVGGPQYGFQGAGTFNLNLSSFRGAQFAGTSNFVRGDFKGVQYAGFSNTILGKTRGMQVAGAVNLAQDSSLLYQFSGFYNHAGRNNTGAQVAGFMNFTGKEYKGVQIAGFMNLSRGNQKGVQVAGFLNFAQKIKGSQIGVVNINDSIDGVPVGFLSFSRKGLHQFEISSNESMPAQLSFKTGVNSFYNSFLFAGRFETGEKPVFGAGYGLGTSVRLNDRNRIFFDLQSMQLVNTDFFEPNSLSKLTVSYQFQAKRNFAFAIGPSLNFLHLYNTNLTTTNDLKRLAPYSLYDYSTSSGRFGQIWVGGHLAIRLF